MRVARRSPPPAEAATGAEALVLMVVNADQARAVLFDAGALDALPPGASVILMATCPTRGGRGSGGPGRGNRVAS